MRRPPLSTSRRSHLLPLEAYDFRGLCAVILCDMEQSHSEAERGLAFPRACAASLVQEASRHPRLRARDQYLLRASRGRCAVSEREVVFVQALSSERDADISPYLL